MTVATRSDIFDAAERTFPESVESVKELRKEAEGKGEVSLITLGYAYGYQPILKARVSGRWVFTDLVPDAARK
jgi:hypothetical protein